MNEKPSGNNLIPEYVLGSIVPILHHLCKPGKLGLQGKVNELNVNKVPVTATCFDCSKSIPVDIAALSKPL